MKQIHKLSSYTSNKIAAGEVITEPLHVVKELLENSVDAGATEIHVNITDHGLKRISVSDNGKGIYYEDSELLFERHATSKLQEDSDLYSISTMGFRGEALASIAAISKVELSSKHESQTQGFSMIQYGSKLLSMQRINRSVGTTIEVSDLFYNTPVRERFLQDQHFLRSHLVEFLQNFAFSHPWIKVRASIDDQVIIRTQGDDNHAHLIFEISGEETLKKLIDFDFELAGVHLKGYLSDFNLSYATTKQIHLFVNNRIVEYPLVKEAILKAYEGLLPKRRYPYVLLFMQTDPSMVDVNRHPRKTEVKLSQEESLRKELPQALREVLRGKPMFFEEKAVVSKQSLPLEDQEIQVEQIDLNFYRPDYKSRVIEEERSSYLRDFDLGDFIHSLEYIGQVFSSFLIFEQKDHLYLMDQHAAHEKVLFETFMTSYSEASLSAQMLMIPLRLKLNLQDLSVLEPLEALGFEFDLFGEGEILIRSIPHLFNEQESLAFIERYDEEHRSELPLDEIIMRSCKAAIKANHPLTEQEVHALLDQLKRLEDPYTCPHGRPIFIRFTRGELERRFAR